MRLKGKIAVITGAGRGIGRDIALAYAKEGANVMINDVDPVTADATVKDTAALGSRSLAVVADVAKPADVQELIDITVKEHGRIDILVNNAMKIVPGKLEVLPEAAWDTTMNIGLKGAFMVSQACAKHMIAQRSGVIVNIASIAGLFPYNWAGAYSVVKAGLIMLTKLQAMEWAPYGIRANAITPGYIRTPGTEAMYADPEIYEGRRKGVPMSASARARTSPGLLYFSLATSRATRPAACLAPTAARRSGIFLPCRGVDFRAAGSTKLRRASPHIGETPRPRHRTAVP